MLVVLKSSLLELLPSKSTEERQEADWCAMLIEHPNGRFFFSSASKHDNMIIIVHSNVQPSIGR